MAVAKKESLIVVRSVTRQALSAVTTAETAGQEWTVKKMIEKLKQKLKTHLGNGIFHDSRADVNAIAEYCNVLTKKINELVDAVNALQSKQSKF